MLTTLLPSPKSRRTSLGLLPDPIAKMLETGLSPDSEPQDRGFDWQPNPGAQTRAYESAADVIGYGGAAGGGKSSLLLGTGFTRQWRSAIYRRHFTDLADLITDGDATL